MMRFVITLPLLLFTNTLFAQSATAHPWVADNGDGTYKNPVLHADYSDPDVIRVGAFFYMVASSFEDVPGLPVLRSPDLVNWTIIGHALPQLYPSEHFTTPRHGDGVWAPSLRYHNGEYFLYYPDPDFGIYLLKTKDPAGEWSKPQLVCAGEGLIDPCPLWDEDGKAYLVHAFAGSRAGIKSLIVVKKMSADGTRTTDEGAIVYDGHDQDPTIEGPKFYKRNGFYYIFAPAGGVSTGWQLALRSKNVYGPYERRVVMDSGSSGINGPHQGAWVQTARGENWFLHFQDKGPYGRVVHLQPMQWVNDWPVIGADPDGDGKGQPVPGYRKPLIDAGFKTSIPAESDEFQSTALGMQWQWMANPSARWYFTNPAAGRLRLFAAVQTDSLQNLWNTPNVLLQKFPAPAFTATAKFNFSPQAKLNEERAGLTVMGLDYAAIVLRKSADGLVIEMERCTNADQYAKPTRSLLIRTHSPEIFFRVAVDADAVCTFSYSFDGIVFTAVADAFVARAGRWKGAKVGIFCVGSTRSNDQGFADFDWFRVEPPK